MSASIWVAAGRISTSAEVTPSDFISAIPLARVVSDVANPGRL